MSGKNMGTGLVYKVGDFEIDLTRVYEVDGGGVRMDDYRWYGVGTEVADAVRKIISGQSVEPETERQPGTCGTTQEPHRESPSAHEGPQVGQADERASAVREQLQRQTSSITSFPGDKAPAEARLSRFLKWLEAI